MADEFYTSAGVRYTHQGLSRAGRRQKAPDDSCRAREFGLTPPFGKQIHRFAKELADKGYVTASALLRDRPPPADRR
jgi:hypothetical protein